MCHLRSAGLQTQGLIKLQYRDRLGIRTRGEQQLMHARACAVLRLSHRDARHAAQAVCISELFNHKPMLDKPVPHYYQ